VAQFAYETGWRLKEIVTREWKHVDLEVGTVRLEPGQTKNGKPRLVYLTPELGTTLAAQREQVTAFGRRRGRIVPWVFFRPTGLPIKSFRKAWANACQRAGVPGRLFHDFRRTAVRDLTRRGVVERVAMQVTGHLTRDVFERYNIVADSDLRAAAQAMSGWVKGQSATPGSKDIAKTALTGVL
jgi:integrase